MTPTERFWALIKHYGGTQVRFAEHLGVTQSTVTAWVQRNSMTKRAEQLIRDHCPEVNYVWLMTGEGEMLKGDEGPRTDDPRNPHAAVAAPQGWGNAAMRTVQRPLYPNVFASCGRYEQFDNNEQSVYINMPDNGSEMYIYAEGCSMEPTIHDGDLIGIRPVSDVERFREDNIYLIVTRDNERMLKRIRPNNPMAPHIEIFTDNEDYHLTAEASKVQKADILNIFRVTFVGTCL